MVGVGVAVAIVYREAVFAYLLEDDFHWFADTRRFEWGNLIRLERYGHFYRPVIEIASRYLYVPAAGFALLLADRILAAETRAARWIPPRLARMVATTVAVFLAIRVAAFAQEGSEGFRAMTAPYEQLVARIVSDNRVLPSDAIVYVEPWLVATVPEIYRNAVAETALCTQGVRLAVR